MNSKLNPKPLVTAVLMALPALGQAQVLEEVIVTAQKRVQSLADVPISVAAVSGDDLMPDMGRLGEELRHAVSGRTFRDLGMPLTANAYLGGWGIAAALDRELNENGYILPGLGDAGDRLFGTR